MSTSAQETRRQHIRAEGDEIAELQARMGQLFRRASMEPARVATDDIELEIPGVTSHRQYHAAQARLEPLPLAYRRDFMATVQPDIMHCVFAELARDHSHGYKWLFDMDQLVIHHRRRALTTTPFAIAGVCRHWREIALDSAVLWSNIHVTETHEAQLEILRLLLFRSRNAPLDVVFPISLDAGYRGEIIRTLSTSTSRWRTAQLRTLVYEALGATLSLLELPTPLLEHVEIDNSKSAVYGASVLNPPSARRRLLPSAPRLQTVDVYSAPIISTLPGASYPSLRSLKWFAPGLEHVSNLLKFANSRLETLDLRSPPIFSPTVSPKLTALTLPKLLNLFIETRIQGIAQFCLLLSMPRLTSISIWFFPMTRVGLGLFGRFFETIACTVTHLHLSSDIFASYLTALRLLHNVEDVHFDEPGEVGESFFAALAVGGDGTEPMNTVWPKLRSIRLSAYITIGPRGLLNFVATRRAPHLDSRSCPRKLETLVFDDNCLTTVWRAQIRRAWGE